MPRQSANQLTSNRINSAASTNATLVKAGVCGVQQMFLMNSSLTTKYVRFYDKASAPTVGTDTPLFTMAIPATSSKELVFGDFSLQFNLGLALAITGGAAVLDATAVVVGDVQTFINFV